MKKSICFSASKNIVLFSLTIVLFTVFTSCQSQKYYPEPEKQIIKELGSRKIVMLGDFAHGAAYPYKNLIALLNEWREQIKTGDSKDTDMTLVMEWDNEINNIVKSFISTGDINKVYDYWSLYNTLETFEFYYDLRSFVKSIDSLNASRNQESKISFEIIGSEPFNIFNNLKFFNKTPEEQDRFAINTRDSLAANYIISSLRGNSKKKAIVFYGTDHLINGLADKQNHARVLKNNVKGYYLVHYLKDAFGNENVLTIRPHLILNPGDLKNTLIAGVVEKTFFIYSKDFIKIDYGVDSYLIRGEPITPMHSLGNLFSTNNISACLQKMRLLKPLLPNQALQLYYDRAVDALKLITGQNFTEISDWERWTKQTNFDGFKRLDSPEFAKMIEDKYLADGSAAARNYLISLGIKEEMIRQIVSKEEWESAWDKTLADIKLVNALGVNMIGTAEEQAKAKKYLISATGKDFQNPADYIKYHRSSVFNVSY